MFKSFNNIETAFQHVRLFTFLFLLVCAGLSIFALATAYRMVQEERARIYILANGRAFEVFQSTRAENIPVELRDHIANFHKYFFTLDPDEQVIQTHMSKAFNLADISAKRAYDNLREQGFYANIISGNISMRIAIDSIALQVDSPPYSFTCYATQHIIRSTSSLQRTLITRGDIRMVTRSDNNPHGFLIQRWETLRNDHTISQ